ncbi:hypothetical protein DAT35_36485 [Vitiosangium sp. GDMCC 1.1324]|nr:hypothetical protein DAT35_36485 [Vitiosangium sp. GDMCC 1.1324]
MELHCGQVGALASTLGPVEHSSAMSTDNPATTYWKSIKKWEALLDYMDAMVDEMCPEAGATPEQVEKLRGYVERMETLAANNAVKYGFPVTFRDFQRRERQARPRPQPPPSPPVQSTKPAKQQRAPEVVRLNKVPAGAQQEQRDEQPTQS